MCRLYGLQATHPTKATCELLDAQNALIRQSRQDARGRSNPHGWGVGHVVDRTTNCFRQVQPASESPSYREAALTTTSTTMVAHVRRATVGAPRRENTHPFRHGEALLIHNGHIPQFDAVRPRLLRRIKGAFGDRVQGATDSEHLLALLLQLQSEAPEAPLHTITAKAVRLVQTWVQEAAPRATTHPSEADFSGWSHRDLKDVLALNVLWTDGRGLAGVRLNRTLWALKRNRVLTCPVCGQDHAAPDDGVAYQAVALASERITAEDWTAVPNGSVFTAGRRAALHVESLDSA